MAELPIWLQLLVYQLPTLIVAFAGAVLALVNRPRHPEASLLALLGCGLILMTGIASLVVRVMLWEQMREGEIPNQRYGELMSTVSLAGSLSLAGGLGLIVAAVFAGRRDPRRKANADKNF